VRHKPVLCERDGAASVGRTDAALSREFPIGVHRFRWGRPVIRALGILKKCAALANLSLSS